MDLKKWRKYGIRAYAIYIFCFYLMLIFNVELIHSKSNIIGLIGNVICFPLFWIGIKYHDEERQMTWKWFALGSFLYLIGEAIWAYNQDILGQKPTDFSICDVFYLANSCICFIGLISYMRQMRTINIMSISFDMVISIIAAAGIIYNFIILPIVEEDPSNLHHLFFVLYNPVMDIALLIGLLIMLFGTENRKFFTPPNIFIGLAFLFMFELDQFSLIIDIYKLPFDIIITPLWSITCVMLALASMYPDSESEVHVKSSFLNFILEYFRILLPYIFTFTILFLIGHEYQILNPLFLWAMALVALLSLRQIFVLIGNQKLLKRIKNNEQQLNRQNVELQKLNQQILHDAEVDFLTQLFNRRFIDKSFERLTSPNGITESLGVMLIDVDYFKHINDTFGHQIGDRVLQSVAIAIRSVIRKNDIAGRFGGDEFIVILPNTNVNDSELVAKKLVDYVHSDILLVERGVTLSIGCTSCNVNEQNYDTKNILKQADDALYKAKEKGRDQYVVFNAHME